jgi:leucyl/phenylalanyl-tRNA--protein transferase
LIEFPDPRDADAEGLIAVGGNLEPETLLQAYGKGIFPWPIPGHPLPWFSPDPRAILEFERLHISQSLKKFLNKCDWRVSFNEAFIDVIEGCRTTRAESWITPAMKRAYVRLHELGHALSVEVWDGRKLVGGLYGVRLPYAFSAESMFHLESNASKVALVHLMNKLKDERLEWIDIQQMSPHLKALGARDISRVEFLKKINPKK